MSIYQVLTNCLMELNNSNILDPSGVASRTVTRVRYINGGVMIESFVPVTDGEPVEARTDVKSDCFWIAPKHFALADWGDNENGNEFVRLYQPTREMNFEVFFVHENTPVQTIHITGDLVRQWESRDVGMTISTTKPMNAPAALKMPDSGIVVTQHRTLAEIVKDEAATQALIDSITI